MSKKAITIDMQTGNKKLDIIIDDNLAIGNQEVTYSGKFVDDVILSVSHDSHKIGNKILDDDILNDKAVISYNAGLDKLVYQNIDGLIQTIDCGFF